MNSSTTSPMNNKSIPIVPNAQVEGEHLSLTSSVEGDHTFEGEQCQMNDDVEGEHPIVDLIVEGE